MSDLERITRVVPAYDCVLVQPCTFGVERCKPGSGGSHGRHNAELILVLKGPEGAVELVISTNWYLPVTPPPVRSVGSPARGTYLSYHSPKPLQGESDAGECMYLGKHCYSSGSYTAAEPIFDVLVEKGSDAAWEELGHFYNESFFGS